MTQAVNVAAPETCELELNLNLNAPRENVWRCWTEPDLLRQWFAPKPWTTPHATLDVRPGGRQAITMRSPEGEDAPNEGVYLDVVPGRKLVTTSAFSEGWVPQANDLMITVIISLGDTPDGGTAYQALVRHWSPEACRRHADMGFHNGWTTCARQLEKLAQNL